MVPNNPERVRAACQNAAENLGLGPKLDCFQLATRYSLVVTDYRLLNTLVAAEGRAQSHSALTPKAANIPLALASVSRYSDSGSLSATMPLPAWT